MATNDNVIIRVTGLKKHYNKGAIKALDGVDIDICKGDVVAVIGPSGSGKSTLLRSMNLLEVPDEGEIIFDIYNDYVSFSSSTLTINEGLPLKATEIILPKLPQKIHSYNYDDSIESTVTITEITYEISGDDLYFYFTGEKTYDEDGKKHSASCKIGWKLYDSDNYIVDSDTFYSPAIAVGEKFRDEKEYVFDVIKPGETYTLKISNSGW